MKDDNWELITGDDAHEIEVLNYSSQVNVIEALVRFIIHHCPVTDNGCPQFASENSLRELHRTGTLFLLKSPGEYRTEQVYVAAPGGVIIHQPPTHETVAGHMATVFTDLADIWPVANPVEAGSFLLWKINWVHPFKNGNGRTARAFCYACICLKFGFVLPGTTTLIELIMQNRGEYQSALRVADLSFQETGTADLTAMNAFVERLLREQFLSIPISEDPKD